MTKTGGKNGADWHLRQGLQRDFTPSLSLKEATPCVTAGERSEPADSGKL